MRIGPFKKKQKHARSFGAMLGSKPLWIGNIDNFSQTGIVDSFSSYCQNAASGHWLPQSRFDKIFSASEAADRKVIFRKSNQGLFWRVL
jgi:hypothetical protein